MASIFKLGPKNLSPEFIKKFLNDCKGFDKVLQKTKVINAGDGACVVELKVEEEHTNPMQIIHGGMLATLVDSVTAYALLTHPRCPPVPSVTVDLHVTFLQGAAIGDEIVINAKTLKTGKNLAYLGCEITNKATGKLLVKGSHTKHFVDPQTLPK